MARVSPVRLLFILTKRAMMIFSGVSAWPLLTSLVIFRVLRVLIVPLPWLSGEGILLKRNSKHAGITVGEEPFSFCGEEDVRATPIDKAITSDLNVMTRRGFFKHTVKNHLFHNQLIIQTMADITFIISKKKIALNGQELHPFDAATDFAKGDKITLETPGKAQAFIIELFAC